ncbi:T9SS type A sorting domain-containing protein [uncultured Lacinutrix sp.]|uniref:T9SS type A sorting domain-containing protein n=1 Tax=uncultured Lacinutrix sp. TaxID=574032 RepID=UPI00261F34E8|nr:T9SS type A sorting domain-containing protein [uncultured Lacinutrix sp.]
MKKINGILLLSITFFSCLVNAQSLNQCSSNTVSIVISSVPGTTSRDFSISFTNVPNQVSQFDGMTLDLCVYNNSSYPIPGWRFYLENNHVKGSRIESSNCQEILGGLTPVRIPPIESGDSITMPGAINIPGNGGTDRFLSTGSHIFNFSIYKYKSSGKKVIKDTQEMNFNVVTSSSQAVSNCELLSKTSNNSQAITTYPNPFINKVVFDISKQNFKFPISLEIYNNKGILEDKHTFDKNSLKGLEYYNNQLSAGIYYYKLFSKNKIVSGSFVRK